MFSPIFISVLASFVFSAANFLGLYFAGKKAVTRLSADTARDARSLANDLKNLSGSVESQFGIAERAAVNRHETLRNEVTDTHQTVKTQAQHLATQAEVVKSHAQQIIDAREQHEHQTSVSRAKCASCQRTVYKFERQSDGSVKCLDCVSRS